ncbi:MAG: DUF1684 domain-containing protein [Cyclobacteriaceae bacterium]|nr:DUF1684 domain-containing protein [Cyclobacteriaceae bacterium]
MKLNHKLIILLFLSIVGVEHLFAQAPAVDEVYKKKLDNWQRTMTRWKLHNFVPLVGLHLLSEGENTFGSGQDNDIVLDTDNAPKFMGALIKEGKNVKYIAQAGMEVELDGEAITMFTYSFDGDRNSETLRHRFIKWYIQFVGDDYFLRVLDDQSPRLREYEPFDYFPATGDFIIQGVYKPYKKPKTIFLDNVIGTMQHYDFSGRVEFRHGGEKYSLEVIGGRFIMFGDASNGDTTFPIGRYLRIDPQEGRNVVTLDFNYAFSPPRSVSIYTTCEFAPDQNVLPFSIEAGEKYVNNEEPVIRNVKR